MCGICGFINFEGGFNNTANIEKMLQEAAEKSTEQARNEPQQLSLFE